MTTTRATTHTPSLNDVDIERVAGLADKLTQSPEAAATVWKASVTWEEGFRSTARIRSFAPIESDEPTTLGGTDTAPNPVEQLLGALGNCLAVGYAANATAAGIKIANLSIELEGDLNLRTFLGLDPAGHAGFEAIRVTVDLDAEATAEQLAGLHHRVIGTSPVGHTLSRAVPVDITLV